jgi:carbamoylphosphate synthase small subunit
LLTFFVFARVSFADHQTGECYITPQNHGYHINTATLKPGWKTLFTNANDGSNEGIAHESRPYFTAQFHPEASSGPTDTEFMFDGKQFLFRCSDWHRHSRRLRLTSVP